MRRLVLTGQTLANGTALIPLPAGVGTMSSLPQMTCYLLYTLLGEVTSFWMVIGTDNTGVATACGFVPSTPPGGLAVRLVSAGPNQPYVLSVIY